MNQKDIINYILANSTGIGKNQAKQAFLLGLDAIKKNLAEGNSTTLIGLGTFKPITRSARKGRNPQTGAELDIPESKSAGFKVSNSFKASLNT